MSKFVGSLLAAFAFFPGVAGECAAWCAQLLPPHCQQSEAEGGCCGDDGFRNVSGANGTCASCTPQGNSYDYMCALCHTESTCNARNRAEDAEAQCEASGCRGGCLMNGECNYEISQEQCTTQRKPWCQACPIDIFNYCFAWADCYAVCSGCCSSTSGGCPEAPYEMRGDGPCAPCQNRPKMCDACFPETICSAEYNESLYHKVVTERMDWFTNVYFKTLTTTKPAEVITTPTTTAASAEAEVSTTPTTTAASAETEPTTSTEVNNTVSVAATSAGDVFQDEEEMSSRSRRMSNSLLSLTVLAFVLAWCSA